MKISMKQIAYLKPCDTFKDLLEALGKTKDDTELLEASSLVEIAGVGDTLWFLTKTGHLDKVVDFAKSCAERAKRAERAAEWAVAYAERAERAAECASEWAAGRAGQAAEWAEWAAECAAECAGWAAERAKRAERAAGWAECAARWAAECAERAAERAECASECASEWAECASERAERAAEWAAEEKQTQLEYLKNTLDNLEFNS